MDPILLYSVPLSAMIKFIIGYTAIGLMVQNISYVIKNNTRK